jgi:hypothetical protein
MAAIESLALVTLTPVFKVQEFRRDLTLSTAWTAVVEGGVTNRWLILSIINFK